MKILNFIRCTNKRFNRTFMELKYRSTNLFVIHSFLCFNRTFMELKCTLGVLSLIERFRFNRTFMELKLIMWAVSNWPVL